MWWKLFLLTLYLILLFVLSRILETVAYYEGGYLASQLLDPVSLSVRRLKTLLDQRGVSYAGVVERQELTDLVESSGEITEGELEAASLTDESASSTNFTCGSHFYEEVEDTKDSVWVVQVIHASSRSFMQPDDWKAFVKKVSRFGVRTGIFDCTLDSSYCTRKRWYGSRLVLALPQGYRAKDNVVISNYMGPSKVQAVSDWVNYNLASRIKQIDSYEELQEDWYSFDGNSMHTKLRILLFSTMNIPPMFYSVLSVKYTGRVKFGNVDTKTKAGKRIAKKLKLPKIPTYQVVMPERNYTFGTKGGEYLNYDSMTLFLKMLHPEVNDLFLLSLVVVNITCWLEFFITVGTIFKRLGNLLWHIGKWNCLLILLWLPILGLFQLPYMDQVLDYTLKLLRFLGTSSLGGCLRYDWLWYSAASCSFLLATFLLFASIIGVLSYIYYDPDVDNASNATRQGEWLSFQWDSYMSYLFRPVATLTRPMNPPDMDLEVGMELLIERLAVPNFWLRPMISSDYIKDLPVWKYTGPCIDSDIGSDTDCTRVESDGEELGYRSDSSVGHSQIEVAKKPLMFFCEKCRALQNNNENRKKTPQQLEQERMESESACAKFLMDGDYKCQCQCQMSSAEHATRRSPKKERYKRYHVSRSSDSAYSGEQVAEKREDDGNDLPAYSMPPGMLDCTECSICLESYRYGALLCGLPCGHSFHQNCIMGWLTRDNHCCPICRWPAYKAKPCSLHLHAE